MSLTAFSMVVIGLTRPNSARAAASLAPREPSLEESWELFARPSRAAASWDESRARRRLPGVVGGCRARCPRVARAASCRGSRRPRARRVRLRVPSDGRRQRARDELGRCSASPARGRAGRRQPRTRARREFRVSSSAASAEGSLRLGGVRRRARTEEFGAPSRGLQLAAPDGVAADEAPGLSSSRAARKTSPSCSGVCTTAPGLTPGAPRPGTRRSADRVAR